MSVIHTYRRFIAGVFLALYVFSATPVSVWHKHCHHYHPSQQQNGPGELVTTEQVASGIGWLNEQCSVCTQHATVYYNDVPLYSFTAPSGWVKPVTACILHLPVNLPKAYSNKGPPAMRA